MVMSGQFHAVVTLPQRKSPLYPVDRRPGGPQSQSGCGGEEKKSLPCPYQELNPGCPAHSIGRYEKI